VPVGSAVPEVELVTLSEPVGEKLPVGCPLLLLLREVQAEEVGERPAVWEEEGVLGTLGLALVLSV
jgi:hypothetical protein